jgi:hypothetical protein
MQESKYFVSVIADTANIPIKHRFVYGALIYHAKVD